MPKISQINVLITTFVIFAVIHFCLWFAVFCLLITVNNAKDVDLCENHTCSVNITDNNCQFLFNNETCKCDRDLISDEIKEGMLEKPCYTFEEVDDMCPRLSNDFCMIEREIPNIIAIIGTYFPQGILFIILFMLFWIIYETQFDKLKRERDASSP